MVMELSLINVLICEKSLNHLSGLTPDRLNLDWYSPSSTEKDVYAKIGSVFILPGAEKTLRSPNMPAINVTKVTAKYLCFYMKYIRPRITSTPVAEHHHLFINTRTCKPLTGGNLASTVKRVFFANGGHTRVTPMSLRSGWATYCFKKWETGEGWKNMSHQQFLESLSNQMNTSPEQLQRTYFATDPATSIKSIENFLAEGQITLDDVEKEAAF